MKRAFLILTVMTSFAGFAAGCGPDEQWCYQEHKTCQRARDDEQARKDKEAADRAAALADAGLSDGGSLVIEH